MANANVRVTSGTVSEQSVQFEVRIDSLFSRWTMERDAAVAHAARVLFLAGVREMRITAEGDVTWS